MESFKAMNPLAFRINDIVVWTGKAWGNPRAGVKVRSNPIGGGPTFCETDVAQKVTPRLRLAYRLTVREPED
jgi:hypothetical protein